MEFFFCSAIVSECFKRKKNTHLKLTYFDGIDQNHHFWSLISHEPSIINSTQSGLSIGVWIVIYGLKKKIDFIGKDPSFWQK
jgi:hypothetical protein